MGDRHMFRASWHDYGEGIFFVTICAREMREIFGEIRDGRMRLNDVGEICDTYINAIPDHYPDVHIHNHVVMPNHIHILLEIAEQPIPSTDVRKCGCLRPPEHGEALEDNHFNSRLSVVVATFKAAVSRRVRPTQRLWQSRYFEHIVRSRHVYENVNRYIDENPLRWNTDRFYNE